jgi:Tfp pilus assembly protein PilV
MEKWKVLAHDALKDPRQPITADTTNVAKFGAAGAVLVTTFVTGVLGGTDNLDFSRSEVVVAAAIIVAAVLLGVYHAFAVDLSTRGAVAITRIETLGELAREEMRRDATRRDAADAAALGVTTALKETAAKLATAQCELKAAQADLKTCREAREAAENARADQRESDDTARPSVA